jgi:membrane protein DedA with SNARE-associated domain
MALAAVHHRFHGPGVDYLGVAVAAAISWFVITGPGEAALIAAGIAAARHRVDLPSVIAVAWAGALAGGIAGWVAGLKGGRALFLADGPLLRRRRRMLASGERIYDRYGVLAVYFAPTWMAGINRMRARRFLAANAVSTLIWALLVGVGAYLVGPSIEEIISDIGLAGVLVLAGLVAAGALARTLRRRRRAR